MAEIMSEAIISDCSNASENDINLHNSSKKRKNTGNMRDVMKKLRTASHELSDDWKCHRYKCFEIISLVN